MLRLLRTIADLSLPDSRSRLKLAVRGGILRITGSELIVGEGFLGSRNLRQVPLPAIVSIEVEPAVAANDGVRLHIRTADADLLVAGVSPLAARRVQAVLRLLRARP